MVIMVKTLAQAINECRYIQPDELISDTVKSLDKATNTEKERNEDNE